MVNLGHNKWTTVDCRHLQVASFIQRDVYNDCGLTTFLLVSTVVTVADASIIYKY